jgi:hypothetical protein
MFQSRKKQIILTVLAVFIGTLVIYQYNNKAKVFTGLCRVSEMKTEASKANKLKLNGSYCVSDYDDEKLARLVGFPWNEHPGCSHFPVKVI